MAGRACTLLLAACLLPGLARADIREAEATSSDWGGLGLLRDPTARLGQDGDVHGFGSYVPPYLRFGASIDALPWAEVVFRWTEIENVPYGPPGFGAGQAYRDRGADLRIRLVQEDRFFPDVTLGLRDAVGTGLFGAEYLVASRRYRDLDISIGLGWGQLASDRMFGNPLGFLGQRRQPSGEAGTIRTDFFTGTGMSLFGGVEYHTPLDGLSLQLEYDPDDHRQDPFGESRLIRPRTGVDLGIVYRPVPWAAISAGLEGGNTAMVKLDLRANAAGASRPSASSVPEPPPDPSPIGLPDSDPARAAGDESRMLADLGARLGWRVSDVRTEGDRRSATLLRLRDSSRDLEDIGQIARGIARLEPAVGTVDLTILGTAEDRRLRLAARALEISVAETGRAADAVRSAGEVGLERPPEDLAQADRRIAAEIFTGLDAIGFTGESFEIEGRQAILRVRQHRYREPVVAVGRAARVMLPHLPSEVIEVTIGLVEQGVDVARVSLLRSELEHALRGEASSEELLHHAELGGAGPVSPSSVANPDAYPALRFSLRPGLLAQLDSPERLLRYDLYAGIRGELSVAPGLSATAELRASMASDFDRLTLGSSSTLPHVRSDVAQYLREGRYGIARLKADALGRIGPDIYGRLSVGMLEEMFGGVDGEILYRPYSERWAIGAEINHVRQRGFHERFGFRPYEVTTAQLEAYYRLPWYGLVAAAKAGRYLAGDQGGTVELWREFDSGVRIGVFATLTNASGRQFGEGRFDKGLFVSVPLDLFLPYASRSAFGFTYRPVTRDGGQLLDVAKPLYATTEGYDPDRLERTWSDVLE